MKQPLWNNAIFLPEISGESKETPDSLRSSPTQPDIENTIPGANKQIRILQRKRSDEEALPINSTTNEDLEDLQLSNGERNIKSELLSLVNSTSECSQEEDCLDQDERFERNCQVFNVSSQDFESWKYFEMSYSNIYLIKHCVCCIFSSFINKYLNFFLLL